MTANERAQELHTVLGPKCNDPSHDCPGTYLCHECTPDAMQQAHARFDAALEAHAAAAVEGFRCKKCDISGTSLQAEYDAWKQTYDRERARADAAEGRLKQHKKDHDACVENIRKARDQAEARADAAEELSEQRGAWAAANARQTDAAEARVRELERERDEARAMVAKTREPGVPTVDECERIAYAAGWRAGRDAVRNEVMSYIGTGLYRDELEAGVLGETIDDMADAIRALEPPGGGSDGD